MSLRARNPPVESTSRETIFTLKRVALPRELRRAFLDSYADGNRRWFSVALLFFFSVRVANDFLLPLLWGGVSLAIGQIDSQGATDLWQTAYHAPLWTTHPSLAVVFYAIASPLMLMAFAFVWWQPWRTHRRFWEPLVMVAAILMSGVGLMEAAGFRATEIGKLVAEGVALRAHSANQLADSYTGFMLLAVALIVGTGLGFRLRLWSATTVIFSVTALALWIEQNAFHHDSGLLVLFVVGVSIVVNAQEDMAKREFLLTRQIEEERQKSELLLLNILPGSVAQRLKNNPQSSIADTYTEVTVLFADIVEFTPLAASLTAPEVVDLLNRVFSSFDTLAQKYGLEKIKTIGDAYMVVGGLPEPCSDHARRIALMALEMQEVVAYFTRPDGSPIRLRIGINSGPVVAGVIGMQKFIYDLWGDTVNIASRMESQGTANQIQMTETTRQLFSDDFIFGPAQTLEVKGRGMMTVYPLLSTAKPSS